ncbi:MAG: glycosyltransferase [Ruminococcaceae bacterium]|nr:glycosyltransferase [Oscillospiraceae bacterium]
MKVSALWITKNEAANIARSIESVKAVADEVVVVDTGSADDTVAIAEKLGARVAHFEWVDDFSAARNWALDQVDGDVVIFMDADEWFLPALKTQDRKTLTDKFANPNLMGVMVQRTNIDPDFDVIIAQDEVFRILRGKGAMRYRGIIHEYPVPTGGRHSEKTTLPKWNIQHTGYSQEVGPGKQRRNRELLQQAMDTLPDNVLKGLYHYYLMRENRGLGDDDDALKHLLWLLEHPKLIRQFMHDYVDVATNFVADSFRLAELKREWVCRKQVYNAIVPATREVLKNHPISVVVELYYQSLFHHDDTLLLEQVDGTVAKAEKLRAGESTGMGDYFRVVVVLYTAAAEAAWRRGQREKALEYATKALQQTEAVMLPETISVLLRCVRGVPAVDIIMFLNRILPVEKRWTQERLMANLQFEGFTEVYAYYAKQLLDTGMAQKSDFWYLMIVLGKPAEAAAAARQARGSTDANVVQRTLFLAAAASGDEGLFRRYQDDMGPYAPPLELMFTGATRGNVNLNLVLENYHLVAFAGGRPAAMRLLAHLKNMQHYIFMTQANYYMSAGLYAELLAEVHWQPPQDDIVARLTLAECQMHAGNQSGALWQLQTLPATTGLHDRFFDLCAALALTAQNDAVHQAATALYASYRAPYEEWVDWQDAVATSTVMEADTQKQRKALAQMTLDELTALVPDTMEPFVGQQVIARQAAAIYAENKCCHAACQCQCRLLSFDSTRTQAQAELAEMFRALKNEALAQELERLARQ